MNLFDRYITRNFLQAYLYCIIGFISIGSFSISATASRLSRSARRFWSRLEYYGTQIPQILVILLPAPSLLALLFVPGGCRARTKCLDADGGYGLIRVLTPLSSWRFLRRRSVSRLIIPWRRMPRWRENFSLRTKVRPRRRANFPEPPRFTHLVIQRLRPSPMSSIMSKYYNRIPPITSPWPSGGTRAISTR